MNKTAGSIVLFVAARATGPLSLLLRRGLSAGRSLPSRRLQESLAPTTKRQLADC